MTSRTMVWIIVLIGVLLGALQLIALTFYLYFTLWWFDIFMHFFGGFWIAMIVLWFYKAFVGEKATREHAQLIVLLVIIIVGIAWEIFEVIVGMTFVEEGGYLVDTIGDLVMDVLGALFAVFLVFGSRVHNKEIV